MVIKLSSSLSPSQYLVLSFNSIIFVIRKNLLFAKFSLHYIICRMIREIILSTWIRIYKRSYFSGKFNHSINSDNFPCTLSVTSQ